MNPISLPKSPTNSAAASDEEQLLSDLPRTDIKLLGMAPFVQVQEGYKDQSGQARLKAVGLMIMLLSLGGSGILLGRALDTRPFTGDLLKLFCELYQDYDPSVLICNIMNITDALYTPQVALFTSGAAVPVGMVVYGACLYNYFPLCFPKVVMPPQSKPEEEIPLQIGSEEGGGEPGPPIFKIFLMSMASYASGMAEGVASHLLEIGQNFEKYCPPFDPFNTTNSTELFCNTTKTPEVVPGVLENARELYLFGGGVPIFILVFSVILYRICCQRK